MSNDKPPIPRMPTGRDPNTGVPIIGTTSYSIFDCELVIDHGKMGGPKQIFEEGFKQGRHGPPKLTHAAPAVFILAAKALFYHQVQINSLNEKMDLLAQEHAKQIEDRDKKIEDLERTVGRLLSETGLEG